LESGKHPPAVLPGVCYFICTVTTTLPIIAFMEQLAGFLNKKYEQYNHPSFIKDDPVCIPHSFTKKQDIEIAAFFAAIFAWGNRTTIINKTRELMQWMDNSPYECCLHASPVQLKKITAFKHRTFKGDDLLYFIDFFRFHYASHPSLETAFSRWMTKEDTSTENALAGFKTYFFSGEHLKRTEKHIASPLQNASCKRLNMFLRWMVRNDKKGVDFGIWKQIRPDQLVCPVDVHVARVARKFNLLQRTTVDWQAALELTAHLRQLDKNDPVKYDFALFGLGVMEKF
jgi:uncharacterized protein (TIGR02757 family)